jgi:GTPase SAR1 family protein
MSVDGILVYSVTSRDSFEEISKLHQEILEMKGNYTPSLILVRNKCDTVYEREIRADGENDFQFVPVSLDSSLDRWS